MTYDFLLFAELDWHRQIRSDSVIADDTDEMTSQTPSMFRHIRWFRMQTSPILQQHPPYSPVSKPPSFWYTSPPNHPRRKLCIPTKHLYRRIIHLLQIRHIPRHTQLRLHQFHTLKLHTPRAIFAMFNDFRIIHEIVQVSVPGAIVD